MWSHICKLSLVTSVTKGSGMKSQCGPTLGEGDMCSHMCEQPRKKQNGLIRIMKGLDRL